MDIGDDTWTWNLECVTFSHYRTSHVTHDHYSKYENYGTMNNRTYNETTSSITLLCKKFCHFIKDIETDFFVWAEEK